MTTPEHLRGSIDVLAVFEKSSNPELGLTFSQSEKSSKKVQKVKVDFSVSKIKFKKLELEFRFCKKVRRVRVAPRLP
jgi:hypothetical protein